MLVTGATGFIGRHLVRRLHREGAEVHATTRVGGSERPDLVGTIWHYVDLGDPAALTRLFREVGPAAVFHLASKVEGVRDGLLAVPMLDANTRTAVMLMTAALELTDCRVVLAGSVEESRGEEPPVSPYAAAKAAATGYARMFHAQCDLPVTVLRIAMVYGPDQPNTRKLVPYAIRCLADGIAPALGSGTRPIDWVYVVDVCDAMVRAATCQGAPGRVLDIGSGRTTTVAGIVRALADLLHYQGPLTFGEVADRRHDVAHVADTGPAAHHLGWRAKTPLHTGLARTLAWYASPPSSVDDVDNSLLAPAGARAHG